MTEVAPMLGRVAVGEAAHSLKTRTLDFKRQGRSREDAVRNLAEAAACFANASGGTLIVGIRDKRALSPASRLSPVPRAGCCNAC